VPTAPWQDSTFGRRKTPLSKGKVREDGARLGDLVGGEATLILRGLLEAAPGAVSRASLLIGV